MLPVAGVLPVAPPIGDLEKGSERSSMRNLYRVGFAFIIFQRVQIMIHIQTVLATIPISR